MSAGTQGTSDHTIVRVALVGNGSVGKSSVCGVLRTITEKNEARLKKGDPSYSGHGVAGFPARYVQTLGSEWGRASFNIRGKSIEVAFIDIGGQSLRSQMLPNYLSGTQVVVFCYDVTDSFSLQDVEDWIKRVLESAKKSDAVREELGEDVAKKKLLYLLGNKIDLIEHIQVSQEKHEKFIRDNELDGGARISAKNGDNIIKFFAEVVGHAIGINLSSGELDAFESVVQSSVKLGDEEKEGRTAIADEIEKEDLEWERKQQSQCVGCTIL